MYLWQTLLNLKLLHVLFVFTKNGDAEKQLVWVQLAFGIQIR